jgi:hypothetical protein
MAAAGAVLGFGLVWLLWRPRASTGSAQTGE